MWTIPLFKVRDALMLKAQAQRAHSAMTRAIAAARGDHAMETLIRRAIVEAELLCVTRIHTKKNAVSDVMVSA